MMMHSCSFKSPNSYLFGHYLKNSIPVLLRYVIQAQTTLFCFVQRVMGVSFFWLAVIQRKRLTSNLIVFMNKSLSNSSYNPFGKACLLPTSPWSLWTIRICSNFMLPQHNFSGKDYVLIGKDSPPSLQTTTLKLLQKYNKMLESGF